MSNAYAYRFNVCIKCICIKCLPTLPFKSQPGDILLSVVSISLWSYCPLSATLLRCLRWASHWAVFPPSHGIWQSVPFGSQHHCSGGRPREGLAKGLGSWRPGVWLGVAGTRQGSGSATACCPLSSLPWLNQCMKVQARGCAGHTDSTQSMLGDSGFS